MYTTKKRGIIMIVIAIIMNLGLSLMVYFFKLPMWLDTVGTIYISIIMGSAFGFCVGLANNVMFSGFLYGYNSISYYFVSFYVAFVAGRNAGAPQKMSINKWIILGIKIFFGSVIIATGLSLWLDSGIPSDYWGQRIYNYLDFAGYPNVISSAVAILIIKAIDVIMSLLLTRVAIHFTPEKMLSDKYCVDLYKTRGY